MSDNSFRCHYSFHPGFPPDQNNKARARNHTVSHPSLPHPPPEHLRSYPSDTHCLSRNASHVRSEDRYVNEKLPKGNTYFSVREILLVPEAVSIIQEAHALNPDGEYLFMCHGRELNNDTFNERLRKYCTEAGVPYLSSHKLRFTVASTLRAAGVDLTYLQKTLGHSNRAMTEHYIYETVEEPEDLEGQLANALSIQDA